jgi:hypothetical protein
MSDSTTYLYSLFYHSRQALYSSNLASLLRAQPRFGYNIHSPTESQWQMEALLSYIAARTGLPLLDLC